MLFQCAKDVSSVGIQYVQPVQVVPVGGPIPALQAGDYQYTLPVAQQSLPVAQQTVPVAQQPLPVAQQTIDRDYQVSSYNTPAESFGPPPTYVLGASYDNPITNYRGPKQSAQIYSPTKKADNLDLYQTSFKSEVEVSRPVRSGRLEECYCVPVAQCPADKIMANKPNKDYSSLINPRVKNPQIDITAPVGRTGLDDIEDTTTVDPEEEQVTEAVNEAEEEATEISRKRRQNDETEPRIGGKLSNDFVFNTEEVSTDPELLKEVAAATRLIKEDAIELSFEEEKLLQKIKEKKKELRKKERQELKKKAAKDKLLTVEEDIEDLDSEDKSLDGLVNLAGDVTNKVGSVGDGVKTGVSRIFGDITNLITTKTSTGQLQPNIGISFGLPQAYPGYAGYPQDPTQANGANTNPYYTAQQGLEVGAVNVNPLFSLQTGTNDNGDLAVKPFVNLHLTPNGCGVLGCDKTSIDDLIPKGIVDAIKNPFGFNSPDYHSHGLSSSYEAPSLSSSYGPPSLSSSYGVPDTSYQAPSTGYGPPPKPSYNAPSVTYGPPPKPSYVAPPKPSYNPPSSGYGPPPKPSYDAPKPSYSAPAPSYTAPATPSYNTPAPVHQNGIQHVHHHYHHDSSNSAFPREETEFENTFYLEENNQVKRNTEAGFVPMQPNFGGESSSPNSGFRFPRERGSRKLDLENVKVVSDAEDAEDDLNDDEEAGETKTEEEEVMVVLPKKTGFKFANDKRKRRSAEDGVKEYIRYVVPSETTIDRSGHPDPFGPSGFRPPTCGGPGSGYVCCSVPAVNSDVGFGESSLSNSVNHIRDIRQPEQFSQALNSLTPQTQFSQYGQCGKLKG